MDFEPSSFKSQFVANTPTEQVRGGGGLAGFLGNAAKSIAHPFGYIGNAVFASPVKELAAQVTGNKTAYKHALSGDKDNLGIAHDANGNTTADASFSKGLKRWAGNSAQVALSLAEPGAGNVVKNAAVGAGYGASSALAQDNSNLGDVLKGGLIGGATGAAVGGVGKIFGKGADAVSGAVDKGAAKVAAKTAEQDLAQKAAQAIDEEAPYSAISKGGREKGNMRATIDFFKNKLNMGVKPEDLQAASNLATGGNGVVSGTMRQLLGDTGSVPTAGVLQKAKESLVGEAGILGDVETKGSHANGVLRSIRDTLQGTAYKGEGNLTGEGLADADNVFATLKKVEGRIQELGNTGADAAEARALKATKSALEDSIYNSGGLDKTVAAYKLNPEDIAAVHANAAKTGVSPEAAQHLIDGINNATTGKDLRALQAPFVNGSKLAGMADRAGEGVLTDMPKATGDEASSGLFSGRNAYYGAKVASGQPAYALPMIANAAKGATGKLVGAGEKLVNAGDKVANVLPGSGTTNGFLSKMIDTVGGQAAGRPGDTTQPESPAEGFTASPTFSATGSTDTSKTTGDDSIFNSDTIQKLIIEDLAQNQGKNVSTLVSLYNTFGKPPAVNATKSKAIAAASNADSALSQIESSFKAAGGGQGKVGGFLSNLSGKAGLNSGVATYNDTAVSLAAQIYKALGNTGTISDQDQKRIQSLLPKTTDTKDTAAAKISQLHSLLQQAEQSINDQ